jgi:hypothetical protein
LRAILLSPVLGLVFLSRSCGNGLLWDIFHHLGIRVLLVASQLRECSSCVIARAVRPAPQPGGAPKRDRAMNALEPVTPACEPQDGGHQVSSDVPFVEEAARVPAITA